MPFYSNYAGRIWDKLYRAKIPDVVTQNKEYLKIRGVNVSKYKEIDEMIKTNKIEVMIPVIKILEYYLDGVEVELLSREDMKTIYEDINGYLNEWKFYLSNSLNTEDKSKYEDLLLGLDRLAKDIYSRLSVTETFDSVLRVEKSIGLVSPMVEMESRTNRTKPDYKGIDRFILDKKVRGRFD